MPTLTVEGKTAMIPTIKELANELMSLKRVICDDYKEDGETVPGIDVTLAVGEEGYSLQSGSNEYMGSAYHYPYWGVSRLQRRSNCRKLAKDLIEDAVAQLY